MRRLGTHVALLAVVLAGGVAAVGTDGVVSADESAMLAELDQLDATGDWVRPNPEPVVDPDMQALPLPIADRTGDGEWAPFAKHPVHVLALRPLWAIGGYGATLALSVAGVVLAAWTGAALAERLRPGTGPAVVWLVGVGSPLAFDVHQVVGHALGAGTFGLAALLVAKAIEDGRVRPLLVLGAAASVAATVLVRTEGALAGLALGGAVGLGGLLRRHRPAIVAGLACGVAAVAARLLDARLFEAVLGAPPLPSVTSSEERVGGLAGRWEAIRLTVLEPAYPGDSGGALLLLGLVLGLAALATWRWRGDDRLFRVLAVAGAAVAGLRLLVAEFLVPGLLPALPLLALGGLALAARGRAGLAAGRRAELWGAAGLFVLAVAATQYEGGGGGEWGGRYFAIGLPLLVALAWVALADATEGMEPTSRRVGGVALAVAAGTLALGATLEVDDARTGSAATAGAVVAAVDDLGVDATISTRPAASRFAFEAVLDGRRWFTVDGGTLDVAGLADALAADGADRIALVSGDVDGDVANLANGWHVDRVQSARGNVDVALLVHAG